MSQLLATQTTKEPLPQGPTIMLVIDNPAVSIQKMTKDDAPKAFINAFECTVAVAGWNKLQ